jgi:hypothetical protein
MAAARDGLYFAEFDGNEGRYFAAWTDLDAAHWTTKPSATDIAAAGGGTLPAVRSGAVADACRRAAPIRFDQPSSIRAGLETRPFSTARVASSRRCPGRSVRTHSKVLKSVTGDPCRRRGARLRGLPSTGFARSEEAMTISRKELLLVALVALVPTAAFGDCDFCKVKVVCEPNCELIDYCAPARGLLGGFCYEDYFFGCYVTNPCMLVDVRPGPLGSPTRFLHPPPTPFISSCS